MCDNTSEVICQSTLGGLQGYRFFDPDAELSPEITALTQSFQNSHSPSNCFYDTAPRLVSDHPDSRTSTGAIYDNSCIRSLTSGRCTSDVARYHFREPSVPSKSAALQWNGMYDDSFVMDHRFTFVTVAPTIPQIKLPEIETLHDQSGISPLSSPVSPGGREGSTSESLSQLDCVSPSQECYTLWKKVPRDAIIITGSNIFVPQTLYKPFTEADKESFEWGISLEDIHNGKTQRLVDKTIPVLQDCGPSISIRINWPGYPTFKRQISSRNWRRMKGPITKEKLAQNLAKTTARFVEKMTNKQLDVGAESKWRVGPQHIKVEDLILVSLHHVSKGSWQPQFRLRDVV